MNPHNQKELVRLLEVDDDKTTKLIEGIVSSTYTIRGWGIALISALIGLTFQVQRWQVAGLAAIVTLLIAFMDGYHSWLYAQLVRHAVGVERVLASYYVALSRGEDDPKMREDFEVAIQAHDFGRFEGIHAFRLRDLRYARPRLVIATLYLTLLVAALVSGVVAVSTRKDTGQKFECSAISGSPNVFVCSKK
jgi:hypothetical protein